MPIPRASQALSRSTVLDLTRVRSGPTFVRQLADWGANVVKIDALLEDAGGEQPGGPRHGSDFQNLHRNKRAMTLNLKDPKGLAVFRRLAEKADVIVENFRPDVKSKLGIDYESVRKINPRIVYGSISGFGQDGPYHKRPGFDQIAQGMGGLMSITGAPGQGPMRVGIPVADLTAGLFCAIGILTALLERDVSGEGQWVQPPLVSTDTVKRRRGRPRKVHTASGQSAAAPPIELFLASLRTAWKDGAARPTDRPILKPKRGRRRPDPLAQATPQLREWFEAEPWRTSAELLTRLQAAYPGGYPDKLLRTLQRRLKLWRSEQASALLFGSADNAARIYEEPVAQ